jgi:hypothetical protein
MNENVEDFYGTYIIASSFKTELTRKGQIVIIWIWEPEGVGKTFEEEFKELANIWLMDTEEAASP